jgi:hypothetical protein
MMGDMSHSSPEEGNPSSPSGPPDGTSGKAHDRDEDPRHDPMAPPEEPCECFCLHCGRTFMSDLMWFQKVKGARDGFPGFWMCPTPNCGGAGFTFDIFPTDPTHPANEGWHDDDEEDEDGENACEEDYFEDEIPFDNEDSDEWDPDEEKYQALDEWDGDDDDLEGEEWKHGLQPGERPTVEAPPPGVPPRSYEEQEALYNEPDRRPSELDWSDRDDRPPRVDPGDTMGEDDIPF